MNLSQVSDDQLLESVNRLVRCERETLISILYHLREIERRRLFSREKQPSLFAYAVQVLGYSEDQAARRISAMRLLKEIPELEEDIKSGDLNLTHLGMAQSAFSRERKAGREFSHEKKKEVLEKMAGSSTRTAEQVISAFAPEAARPDRVKAVGESVELRFHVKPELLEQIEELRGRLAHSHPGISLGELMAMLCSLGLEATEPAKSPATPRFSEAEVRRQVWRRDKYCCTNCQSRYAVQIDHITPRAAGGPSTLENMRLLCRSCNQRAAIDYFGQKKMDQHLGSVWVRYG